MADHLQPTFTPRRILALLVLVPIVAAVTAVALQVTSGGHAFDAPLAPSDHGHDGSVIVRCVGDCR